MLMMRGIDLDPKQPAFACNYLGPPRGNIIKPLVDDARLWGVVGAHRRSIPRMAVSFCRVFFALSPRAWWLCAVLAALQPTALSSGTMVGRIRRIGCRGAWACAPQAHLQQCAREKGPPLSLMFLCRVVNDPFMLFYVVAVVIVIVVVLVALGSRCSCYSYGCCTTSPSPRKKQQKDSEPSTLHPFFCSWRFGTQPAVGDSPRYTAGCPQNMPPKPRGPDS